MIISPLKLFLWKFIYGKNKDDSAKNASHSKDLFETKKMRILVFVILVNSQHVTKREKQIGWNVKY